MTPPQTRTVSLDGIIQFYSTNTTIELNDASHAGRVHEVIRPSQQLNQHYSFLNSNVIDYTKMYPL